MIRNLFSFFRIAARQQEKKKDQSRIWKLYSVTLDLDVLRQTVFRNKPQATVGDAKDWLMRLNFRPTANPHVWKASEEMLERLPKHAILKSEKL